MTTLLYRVPIPAGMLEQAQSAFTQGMNMAATVSGITILTLALLSVASLRQVWAVDNNEH